jgi:arylsulfatase A-like enzyme
MPAVLVLAILGCSPTPDPLAGLPSLPFEQSGQTALQLDHLPMRVALPASTVPAAALPKGSRFEVGPFRQLREGGRLWAAPLPYPGPTAPPGRDPPVGVTVREGETELEWDGRLDRDAPVGRWRLHQGRMQLAADAAPTGITIDNPHLADVISRLDPTLSKLAADDFVHWTLVGPVSHRGLLLPAPASAEWDVVLPAGATFRGELALVKNPLDGASDGAEAILSVVVGGTAIEVGRTSFPAAGEPAYPWSVDLTRWATDRVTLRLETSPGANADFDWAFIGAPAVDGTPTALPRRVVVIGIDTMRPDHLGNYGYAKDTSPELDALAAQSTVFEDARSPAPRTRPSFRTATTGHWPLAAVGAKSVGHTFADHGWATAGIVANTHLHPRFGFHEGYDTWWLDPDAKANDQVDRGLAWLDANRQRDAFLFLHVMDPHLLYVAPEPYFEQFVTDRDPTLPAQFNRWQVYGWMRQGLLSDVRKSHIIGRYDGEIRWTSSQIGRFIQGLDAMPGRTLVVFHTDHGEELWDHDGFEHNHTLYEEVVRTALWVRPPEHGTGRRVAIGADLVDLAATLYDYAGITDAPPTDGVSLRPFADGDPAATPPIRDLPVAWLRYDVERWGVIHDGHKYILFTGSGRQELYDLAADPHEHADLSTTADLAPYEAALGRVYDVPVGPGWRVTLRQTSAGPAVITLPEPCVAAEILDPESLSLRPVNEEWGEVPPKVTADVGALAVSDDNLTLTFTPGTDADGIIAIVFDHPVEPGGTLQIGDATLEFTAPEAGKGVWSQRGDRFTAIAGTVILPPEDEAQRMADLARSSGAAAASDLELLESLGYIGGEGR